MIGIYIHIPFCKQKCYYCDFVSYANKECFTEKYIESLISEIESFQNDEVVDTIYIGGGTPSYINEKYIEKIINVIRKKFNVIEDAEITIEINPGTITKEKLELYKEIGINRLSIGMQSVNNNLLKKIGRIHTFDEFDESYNLARNIGFKNINIDLIIGLPKQNMKDIENTIYVIKRLNPEHVSVYSLILEEGTVLEKLVNEKKEKLPEEEIERKMYWKVKNELEKIGYKHYEISNYAKPGFESKHNLNCWEQKEYIGFGVAAHSYYKNKRYSNIEDLDKYIENFDSKIIYEIQTKEEKQKEYMLLGLRKIDGVSMEKFTNIFSKDALDIFKENFEKLQKYGLIDINKDNIKLSDKGIDLANIVWEEFI